MPPTNHHFGDDSQARSTDLVIPINTNLVPTDAMKKEKIKYPNGLAAAMAARPDVKQADLAREAGTSPQQVGRLFHGDREMTAFWAERLAPALNVSPEELVFPGLKRIRVPLLSWVSAGKLTGQDGVRRSDIRKYVLAAGLPKGDWIALQVEGDSMNRVALDGSYILVNRADDNLIDDRFYVFSTPTGEATFKRYRSGRPPRLQPFSTNPDHETIILSEEMNLIGRVGRVVTDLI